MEIREINELEKRVAQKIRENEKSVDMYMAYLSLMKEVAKEDAQRGVAGMKRVSGRLSELAGKYAALDLGLAREMLDVRKRALLAAAPMDFDSYLLYVELNRRGEDMFYVPRRFALKPLVDALMDLVEYDKLDLLTISMPPGTGKALANDTPVFTRNGWKYHGDLVVGDEVVGLDGQYKKVIAVHPKCKVDCLVEFTNGERVLCHENHEWMVHDRARSKNQDHVLETKEIEKRTLEYGGARGKRGHRYVLQLPHKGCFVGEEKELPLDPYTLGVWLGDGTNTNPTICCSQKDKAVIERVVKSGHEVRWQTIHKITGVLYYGFGFRKQLRAFGMCHSKKNMPKHIPEIYLTASVEQRLQLLAGLLDTDGTRTGSKYQFTTVEKSLRDTFVALLSTFGWRASVMYHPPAVSTSRVVCRNGYYVISFTPDMVIPCELERKRNDGVVRPQRAIAFKGVSRVEPKYGNCITVEGDGMYLVGRTMVPTHNSALAIFLLTWLAGKYPDDPILTGSHNHEFIRGAYDECLRIMNPRGDYLWSDVFPHVKICSTNAKDCRIDIGKSKRFETMQFTTIGSGNAGLYRAIRLLFCDDLVSGSDVAYSMDRLNRLWSIYNVDLRQRKLGKKCKELHIATRWSVHDVLGRLEEKYGDDPRARFICVPLVNEDGHSNFAYSNGLGYYDDKIPKMMELYEDADWAALYLNSPIERMGRLYDPDELQRYFELPEGKPDAIISVCDTKDRGSDDCVMPVAYVYGEKYYIEEIYCDNGKPEVVDEMLIQTLLKHKVQMSRFESNSAGGRVARTVQEGVKARGGITKIETAYTTANKGTKIQVNSPWVKARCLFKDDSVSDKAYKRAMRKLCSYTTAGVNKHDDVPDAFAQLAAYAETFGAAKVQVIPRPF